MGMQNLDIWAAEFIDNQTTYNLYDMFSNNYLYPFMDTDIGGTYDFTNINYTNVDNHTVLSFTRKLNTSDYMDNWFEIVLKL
jgi:hypothetical protein